MKYVKSKEAFEAVEEKARAALRRQLNGGVDPPYVAPEWSVNAVDPYREVVKTPLEWRTANVW